MDLHLEQTKPRPGHFKRRAEANATKTLRIRVTPREYEIAFDRAAMEGVTVSELIREFLLGPAD